ncbi:MAG: hypothetical protein QF437_00320 [Planctomycetota bacterium]|nr:hypothetical protein [Planctomycetota bacterium]
MLPSFCLLSLSLCLCAENPAWLWSTAYEIPKHTTSEGSGYFSIIEGHNRRLYIGTAKYGENAFLVEFDTTTKKMRAVVDAHKEIGTKVTGFAAQAKVHTRNNVGKSGKIYFGTKQGYPKKGESRKDYPGGYPMVYDPKTGKTRVYPIPIRNEGIISITPDESRGIAYISTSSDARTVDDSHFMILDLDKGTYRDFGNLKHMFAFIVLDHRDRAYHPEIGGKIVRYDPTSGKIERLKQTIDGKPPTPESLLANPKTHPINWDISKDRKTLYTVAMSGNQLFSYDLTAKGDTLPGRSLGELLPGAKKTDCRALCVGPDGTVWMGVASKHLLHVVSYREGEAAPKDHGIIAIKNPKYTKFTSEDGKSLKWHHGVMRSKEGTMLPRYHIMGICAGRNGKVYATSLYPFTLHEIDVPGRSIPSQ